ncbi:MAG: MFS transporter, partial [Tumebacillaceae bacterium]
MKNKWLYLTGDGWNSFGDGLQAIVMTSWVYLLTGSALSVGYMIAVTYLPSLFFAPWAGVWADHRDAKRLAVWTDVGRAGVVLVMAAMVATGSFSLLAFYGLQMLLAFGNMLFKPASQALVKETFVEQDLVFVLTKSSTISELMTLVGSGVGGWLSALVRPEYFLLINAATFAVSAGCNASLRRVATRTIRKQMQPFLQELAGGWTFIRDTRGMLYLLGLSVVSSWSMQMSTTLL